MPFRKPSPRDDAPGAGDPAEQAETQDAADDGDGILPADLQSRLKSMYDKVVDEEIPHYLKSVIDSLSSSDRNK